MCNAPEPERIEHSGEPVGVPVTPEWRAENAAKQRRYEQERTAWLVFIGEETDAE